MADNRITFLVALGCICLFIILMPIIGGIWFGIAHADEKHSIQTKCLTMNYTISSRESSSLIVRSNTWYALSWTVMYNTTEYIQREAHIPHDTISTSYANTVKAAQKYPINSTSTCYYDDRQVDKVEWEKPSSGPALIFLSTGISIYVAVGLLALIVRCMRK